MGRKRRKFTDEFKRSAVALTERAGASVGQIATDLDVGESVLRRWMAIFSNGTQDVIGPLNSDERAELVALRKRLREVETEREILKKPTAFFAKESK